MKNDRYIQAQDSGIVYKVMNDYLLQMSPWDNAKDRRIYSYENENYNILTYQNACMIVNKQFASTTEKWTYGGKEYLARPLNLSSVEEHTALINMLPSHYIKESSKILSNMDNGNEITIKDKRGNELKMVKHKGKVCYILIINEYLPKVKLHDMFGNFCQWVNIKNVKPIYCETDKKYI